MLLQTMYPKLQTSDSFSFIGLPEGKKVSPCLYLIWQSLPCIICCQPNMGTMRILPSFLLNQLQWIVASFHDMPVDTTARP